LGGRDLQIAIWRSLPRNLGGVGADGGQAGVDEFLSEIFAAAAAAADAADFFELIHMVDAAVDGFVNLTIGDGFAQTDEHGRRLRCSESHLNANHSRLQLGTVVIRGW
jgi:hypothetical protein